MSPIQNENVNLNSNTDSNSKIDFLDVVSYISKDYLKKTGIKKKFKGIVMGIGKDKDNIISEKYYHTVVCKQGSDLYFDDLYPEELKLVKQTHFRDDKIIPYMDNWPKKNIVLPVSVDGEGDYGLLVNCSLSTDTSILKLKTYSLTNCESIANPMIESCDNIFFKRFIGFDDYNIRDIMHVDFRCKSLEYELNKISKNNPLPLDYTEYDDVWIHTIQIPIQKKYKDVQ